MRKATRTKTNSTANRKRKKGDRYEYDYPDLPSYGFVTLSLIKFTKAPTAALGRNTKPTEDQFNW